MSIAERLNDLRVVPRLMMLSYMALLLYSSLWFMGLPSPSTQQAGFAAAILAAGTGWFTIYVNSGVKK
jgi:hypothetical protein